MPIKGLVVVFVAANFAACIGASAQSSGEERMVVRVAPPENISPFSLSLRDCSFVQPYIDGVSAIYECGLSDFLEVDITEGTIAKLLGGERSYGLVVPRTGTAAALPLYPFLEVVEYVATLEEAAEHSVLLGMPDAEAGIIAQADEVSRDLDGTTSVREIPPKVSLRPVARPSVIAQADTGENTKEEAVEGEEDVVELASALVVWPERFHDLVPPPGVNLVPKINQNGLFYASISYDPKAIPAGGVDFKLERNPNCNALFQPLEEVEPTYTLEFPCGVFGFFDSGVLGAMNPACERTSDGSGLACLLTLDTQKIDFSTSIWSEISVDLSEVEPDEQVDLAGMVPRQAAPSLELSPAVMATDAAVSCAEFDVAVRFGGYCSASDTDSCDAPAPGVGFTAEGRLPSLLGAGWLNKVPNFVRLQVDVNGTLVLDEVTPLSVNGLLAFEQAAARASTLPDMPLVLDIANDQFGAGRTALLFDGPDCSGVPTASIDLALRGLGTQKAPLCGSVMVKRDNQRVSACAPLNLSADRARLTAALPPDSCIADRIAVVVAQNRSLNGLAGRATLQVLEGAVVELSELDSCLPVDLATTQNERRDILSKAEELYFGNAEEAVDNIYRMSFVNPSSEILRDLRWVYREWGERLSALILIADSSSVFVSEMTDSPEALAWEVLGVPAVIIDPLGGKNCETFKSLLFFDDCIGTTPDGLAGALVSEINSNVARVIGGGQ